VAKEILESKPRGRRKVRKPKFLCLEEVENDLGEFEMKRWIQSANN
jgi:hypothetical protein